ncbi:hypothetical protein [Aquimarina sp. 2304DJ70-9]|uniref:hypothetical protein n=1 Tax=Aquimarina penaris TaxID=3231044 RepID=UPI003462906D
MKNINQHKYAIAVTFIWIGFVCAISFMEAWLKFQAPGITTNLGLGIGQLVFNALNKVEIVCAILVGILLFFSKNRGKIFISVFFLIPLLILSIQTLWLLPALDHRADLIIKGIDVPKSRLHLWYVVLEIVKIISLFIYGNKLFPMRKNQSNNF